MKQISERIIAFSSNRITLICLLIFVFFLIFILPDQSAKAAFYTNGIGSPDTSLFYTADDLYQFAEQYGEAGRSAYIRARFTFDIAWPIAYTLFLVTAISWFSKQIHIQNKLWQQLNLIPFLGFGFDMFENSSASLMMARYPEATPFIAHLAGWFTLSKWIFIAVSFLILLLLLISYIAQKLKLFMKT
jgi:hypothetical protein